nr:methyltransferase type 11 [Thermoleophilaceae bacterium]
MNPPSAREAVAANPHWYHSIEVAPGVVTPGQVDLRGTAEKLLPPSLASTRALDVGTFDGFWAFEMERRGAEVVAIDVP